MSYTFDDIMKFHPQNESDACISIIIQRLEKLHKEYPNQLGIAIVLARILGNLCDIQNETDSSKTIQHLEKLYKENSEQPEIAVIFASSLFNLITS